MFCGILHHFIPIRRSLLRLPAYANERLQQNQKCLDQEAYSTLGDAILKTGLILSLWEKGFQTQGDITREKEKLEKNTNRAKVGKCLKIRKFILLGRGEREQWKNGEETILADNGEAFIGAIFIDSKAGFCVVNHCIDVWFEPELRKIKRSL